jgi:hypothetical protein
LILDPRACHRDRNHEGQHRGTSVDDNRGGGIVFALRFGQLMKEVSDVWNAESYSSHCGGHPYRVDDPAATRHFQRA